MSDIIKITLNGESRFVPSGLTLSELIKGEQPCGGHGKCGKCKVYAKGDLTAPTNSERSILSAEELGCGIRLACVTRIIGECEIRTLDRSELTKILTDGETVAFELKPTFKKYGAAVDIGTTTLAARLYDTSGTMLSAVSRLNPQSEWGADVISRIEASMSGKSDELAYAICHMIEVMFSELALDGGIDPTEIDTAVITGNTVMLSLLTRRSLEPFSHAPFEAEHLFGETLSAKSLGFSLLLPDAKIILPPCISAFVGADTVCALLATDLCGVERAMLADIGTNGEMALWQSGKLTVCSTAAGPAFEGVGIAMGMRGAIGAIDRVQVKDGALEVRVIGDGRARGICGSGLVDAAASLLELEILDETGALDDDPVTLKDSVTLCGKDIRMLQLAKSAISAGLLTLIGDAGLETEDVSVLYVAGGFGRYLNKESAARIGMLPLRLAEASKTVGNAALGGASMMLLNSDLEIRARELAKKAQVLDLSKNKCFSEQFMMGMIFEEIE